MSKVKHLVLKEALLSPKEIIIECRSYKILKDGIAYQDNNGDHFISTKKLYFVGSY